MLVRANNYHQRGETIMSQGVLPFQYQDQKSVSGLTALAGLPAYLDLAQAAGLRDSLCRHLKVRSDSTQGWSDHQIVLSLILLNIAGGDCVADLEKLEADEGLCLIMQSYSQVWCLRTIHHATSLLSSLSVNGSPSLN